MLAVAYLSTLPNMKACFVLRCLCLLVLVAGLSTCKKEKLTPLQRLPPATTTGANTWGCLVNGEAWTATGDDNMRADWTTASICSCTMSFSSRSVSIGLKSGFVAGNYSIAPPPNAVALAKLQIVELMYPATNVVNGTLLLTRLDRQAGVMSGTFAFTTVGNSGDTLHVTDGRFDVGNMDR
jgi:hypothetical protein